MKKVSENGDIGRHLGEVYCGMFAGMMFLMAIASTTGIASSVFELVSLVLLSLSSAFLFLYAQSKLAA